MSLNKMLIIGNLGADPDVRFSANGNKMATINVATSDKYKTKDGEQKETTEWHRVVAFKGIADIMERYLKKGSKVYIEGPKRTRPWNDNNGNKNYTTEIICKQIEMLGGGESNGGKYKPDSNGDANGNVGSRDVDLDEDLPF